MAYNKKPYDKGRDSYRNDKPAGPMTEIGTILHPCEATVVAQITLKQKLPFPSAFIYLGENRKIGRVDEVLGPVDDVYLSIKLDNGILPSSFTAGQKIFATGDKIMPSSRVTEPKAPRGGASKPAFGARTPQRGAPSGGRGGSFGGRGGSFGGRGGSSGGRGGSSDRGGRGGRGGFAARR